MSLINKMLRDLDARHAPPIDRAALPDSVHVLARERRRPWRWIGLGLGGVLAAASYLLVVQDGVPWRVALLGAVPQVKPLPAASAPAAPTPALPAPAPAPATPAAPAVIPPTEPAAVQAVAAAPATSAASPPPLPAAPASQPAVEPPVSAASPAASAAPAARPAPVATKAAEKTAARPAGAKPADSPPAKAEPAEQGGIEKRPRGAVSNEAAEAEYQKAIGAVRRGATSAAIDSFHVALRLDSRHTSARQALLSLLVEQRRFGEAMTLCEEGLAVDPSQSGWAMALARMQLEAGKLTEAVETLSRHAAHAGQNAEYQAFHALLFHKQKRLPDAAERYRTALALKPAESRWWYGLALVLEADHKPQEARDAYLRARETGNLPPDLARAVESRLR